MLEDNLEETVNVTKRTKEPDAGGNRDNTKPIT